MPPDDAQPTSSKPSYEERRAEQDSPAARRKWSPERRKEEAEALRLWRQMKKAGVLDDPSKTSFQVGDEIFRVHIDRFPNPSRQRPDQSKRGGRKR